MHTHHPNLSVHRCWQFALQQQFLKIEQSLAIANWIVAMSKQSRHKLRLGTHIRDSSSPIMNVGHLKTVASQVTGLTPHNGANCYKHTSTSPDLLKLTTAHLGHSNAWQPTWQPSISASELQAKRGKISDFMLAGTVCNRRTRHLGCN